MAKHFGYAANLWSENNENENSDSEPDFFKDVASASEISDHECSYLNESSFALNSDSKPDIFWEVASEISKIFPNDETEIETKKNEYKDHDLSGQNLTIIFDDNNLNEAYKELEINDETGIEKYQDQIFDEQNLTTIIFDNNDLTNNYEQSTNTFKIQNTVFPDYNLNLSSESEFHYLRFFDLSAEKKLTDSFMKSHSEELKTCQLEQSMIEDDKKENITDSNMMIFDNSVTDLLELNQNQNTVKENKEKAKVAGVIAEESGFQSVIEQVPTVSASILDNRIDVSSGEEKNFMNFNFDPRPDNANTTLHSEQADLEESDDSAEFDSGVNDTSTVSANLSDENKINSIQDSNNIIKEQENAKLISDYDKIIPTITTGAPPVPAATEIVQAPARIAPIFAGKKNSATFQNAGTSTFMIFVLFGILGLIVFVAALEFWQYRKAQVQL